MRVLVSFCLAALALASVAQAETRPGEPEPVDRRAADLCPGTTRTAVELAFGCTAIELVRRPEVFVVPVLETLDARGTMLAREREFATAARDLERARARLERAALQFESGALCHGARGAERALADLGAAGSSLDGVVDAFAETIAAARMRAETGDVEQQEVRLASWRLQQQLVADATGDAREAAAAFDATCAAIVAPLDVRGTVRANDDAAGLIELEDGGLIGLAAVRFSGSAAPGAEVAASGVRFNDGTGLATQLKSNAKKAKVTPSCSALRIAPIQSMPPYHVGPYTLHRPRAYEGAFGVLELEQGMRLGSEHLFSSVCPGATPDGHALHYGLTIDVEQGPLKQTVAVDLREGDGTVGLPAFLALGETATITTTVFRTECVVLGPDFESCQQPVELTTTSYTILVRAIGSYASVAYSKTAFSVTDDGQAGDFESGTVVGVLTPLIPASTNPTFSAEGYKVINGVSSRPVISQIQTGDSFAVYNDDFYDPGFLFMVDQVLHTGQEKRSGLRWARVVGTRNGSQFWYSATLPSIVHDKVATCPFMFSAVVPMGNPNPDGPPWYTTFPPAAPYTVMSVKDSFYKLPFSSGVTPGTGLLNIDDPQENRRHPEWQAYALDLGAGEGTVLRAARGGEVTFVEESDPYNLADPTPQGATPAPEGWTGIGNYLFIKHEDGTYAVYFHVVLNSVAPNVGAHVRRGQQIAAVGMTGSASGPHVHFGVATTESHDDSDFVKRVRYEASVGGEIDSCFIPRSTDTFASTNSLPVPD